MSWRPAYARYLRKCLKSSQFPWVRVTPYYPHHSVNLPRHLLHSTPLLLLEGDGLGHLHIQYIIQQRCQLSPCLDQFEERNVIDNELSHRTTNSCFLCQKIKKFTICDVIFLFNSFFASVQLMMNSIKCHFSSRKYMYAGVSWLGQKIHSLFERKYGHFCPMYLWNPNWLSAVHRIYGSMASRYSNDLLKYLAESCGNCNWLVTVNICWIYGFVFQ